jgi:signal transduction histidine kinase/CheY-like chemotaxis protein/ligand-binding sensor domain-containing protein
MPRRTTLAVWILLVAFRAAAELPFTHFTPDAGVVRLPSASVQKMIQDRAGHLWLAFFSSGLARYDGHSMETFGVDDGLVNLTVREVAEDPSGHLWVGSATSLIVSDGAIDSAQPRRIQFVSKVGGVVLPVEQVRRNALAVDPDGWVSIAVNGRIAQFRFDAAGHLSTRTIATGAAQAVLTIASDGALLGALDDGRFVRVPRGSTRIEMWRDSAYGARVATAIFETSGGDLVAGTVTGEVWRRRRGGTSFEQIRTDATERVTSFVQTRDGRLWVATLGSGLLSMRIDGGPDVRHFTRRDGLLGETLWSLLVDREGNLWIGQNGGLSRLRYDFEAFESLTAISHTGEKPLLIDPGCFGSLPPNGAVATAGDPASWLWIATGGGVTIIGPGGATRELRVADGLLSNADYGVGRDESGTVWIATAYGLNAIVFDGERPWTGVIDRRRVRLFDRDATIVSFAPKQVTYRARIRRNNHGEAVMCAGGLNGLSCLVDDKWLLFGRGAGLYYAYDFDFDDDGRLWVARYDAGVFRSREPLTIAAMRRLAASSPSGEVTAPTFDHVEGGGDTARAIVHWNGEVWSGVAGGVAVFRGGRREAFLQRRAIGGDFAGALAVSPHGTMWVAQNAGLVELDRERRVVRRVTARDGLIAGEVWGSDALAFAPDGRLYFATPKGVSIVRTNAIGRNTLPPALRVEQFDFLENKGGLNDVSIGYAALSFANEEKVRYRTRLAGYEKEWSPPVTATALRYTNLPAWLVPKRYVFEVMAANNDGIWSKPFRFAFTIHPAWWRRWWALASFVAALALIVVVVHRRRTRQLETHNRELAQTVEDRTHELRDQTRELELLDGIVETINRETSLDRLLHSLLDQGAKLLPQTEKGLVFVVDHEQQEATVEATIGYALEQFEALDLSIDDAVRRYADPANAVADGIFVVAEHQFAALHAREKIEPLAVRPPKSMLTMRVGVGERADGFLVFDNFSDVDAFGRIDVEMLARFRRHALSAIEKARMLREVSAANQAKSAFLAKMSHEIRTPLNAILGFVQLMMRGKDRSAEDRESLSIVMRSGEHLLGLINDVLSLAKIEAGRVSLNEIAFDCARLVRAVAETVSVRAAAKKTAITVDVSEFPANVRGDSGKLRQVLLNLLDNAIKFSDERDVAIHARWAEGRATFEVEDRGVGMSRDEVAKLFQPFVQNAAGAAAAEGTGLGLAICRTFVELMGGAISVESELGRGSRFTFEIPLAAIEEVHAAERRRVIALAPDQPRYRILVADDTDENRVLLEKLFTPLGFDVLCVADGQAAIDRWSEWKPDLVWMDIRMPVVDGFGATRAIRAAEGDDKHTVVIALTASAFEHDRERILAAGCDDFVAKPFLEETLFEKLSHHLGVQWIYDEGASTQASARFAGIPPALRARLAHALECGDVVAAQRVNDQLRAGNGLLAAQIGELLKAYRFDDVQAIVDAAE